MKVLDLFKALTVFENKSIIIWLHLAIINLDCQSNASSPDQTNITNKLKNNRNQEEKQAIH